MKTSQFAAERNIPAELTSISTRESEIKPPNFYAGSGAFDKLVSDSISEALTDLLGTRAREAVFDYMERNHSVSRDELPRHINHFNALFERNFGPKTKVVMGRAIAKRVYSKLDWQFEPISAFELSDYLENVKGRIAREASNSTR